jgi:starvation-inducible DNA-binding protein
MTKMNTEQIGAYLQATLVELTDLSLQAKQAHWNLTGPQFLPLHTHLDTLTAGLRTAADEVAERAVAIGYAPDARATTVAKASPLPEPPAGPVADHAVVKIIARALDAVAERVRARVQPLEELDPVSQDLLIGISRDLDKQRWMFNAQRA